MDIADWYDLLRKDSSRAAECPKEYWDDMILESPELLDICPENIVCNHLHWNNLFEASSDFIEKCPWEKLPGDMQAYILTANPQFADKCNLKNVSPKFWYYLLSKQPQFADKCDWKKLDTKFLIGIVATQPQFVDKLEYKASKITGDDVVRLLKCQGQLADQIKDLMERLNGGGLGKSGGCTSGICRQMQLG